MRKHDLHQSAGLLGENVGLNVWEPQYLHINGAFGDAAARSQRVTINAQRGRRFLRLLNAGYSIAEVNSAGSWPSSSARTAVRSPRSFTVDEWMTSGAERYEAMLRPTRPGTYPIHGGVLPLHHGPEPRHGDRQPGRHRRGRDAAPACRAARGDARRPRRRRPPADRPAGPRRDHDDHRSSRARPPARPPELPADRPDGPPPGHTGRRTPKKKPAARKKPLTKQQKERRSERKQVLAERRRRRRAAARKKAARKER